MRKTLINSQLTNFRTFEMYKRQCISLASNVFKIENLPDFIDVAYINNVLIRQGSIAWFYDKDIGLLALPYANQGSLDVYGRPKRIIVHSNNGYVRTLEQDEFVIMYDNTGRYPMWLDIIQYAERLALCERTSDINITQQKTPRFFKTSKDKLVTLNDLINRVDGFANTILTYENIDLDDTTAVMAPAPFVAHQVDDHKEKVWNEFLRLIGVANYNFRKQERNISDEIHASQGGTIASRFSRYEPRLNAINKINAKWGLNLELTYYDGLPTTMMLEYDINNIQNENKDKEEVE